MKLKNRILPFYRAIPKLLTFQFVSFLLPVISYVAIELNAPVIYRAQFIVGKKPSGEIKEQLSKRTPLEIILQNVSTLIQ